MHLIAFSLSSSKKKMAIQKLVSLISLLLFLGAFASVNAIEEASSYEEDPEDKHIDVVVEGVVYCQSCKNVGTWSLTGAKPIPAAKISVICKNHKSVISFYKVFSTDKSGYFYGRLDGFKMTHYLLDHPLHSCSVRLVSSSIADCNQITNLNYGLNGASLRYQQKRVSGKNYEAVVYAAGPLAFHPDKCY